MIFLHIIHDDKFIDTAIDQFEYANPNKNIYILLKSDKSSLLKHIKKNKKIVDVFYDENEFLKRLRYSSDFDTVIFHAIPNSYWKYINYIPTCKKIVWLSWGVDIYNNGLIKINLYQNRTRKYIIKNIIYKSSLYSYIFQKIKQIQLKKQIIKSLNRFDYFAPIIPDEINYLTKIDNFRAKLAIFSYGFNENIINNNETSKPLGNSILIGNSASIENNHIDVFEKLYKLKINAKIIAPLNYGDMQYRNDIIKIGRDKFNDKFLPLIDFLSIEEYNIMLKDCCTAIFYHNRQQALGNIVLMLWQGAKVFLSEDSITYKYLKSKNLHVYSFQSDLNSESLLSPLTEREKQTNRAFIYDEYSNDSIMKKTKNLIEICQKST